MLVQTTVNLKSPTFTIATNCHQLLVAEGGDGERAKAKEESVTVTEEGWVFRPQENQQEFSRKKEDFSCMGIPIALCGC